MFLGDIKATISVTKSVEGDDSYLDVFFPTFVMVVRDNSLKTEDAEGNPITADHFMENVLKLRRGVTDNNRKFNEPRLFIRRYFKNRKCFMLNHPQRTRQMDDTKVKLINKEFEGQIDKFMEFIFDCKPKRMTSGKILNGRMLGNLVISYTRYISKGQSPCLHEAAKEMIECENQSIVQLAVDVYKKELQTLIGENMPSADTMGDLHQLSMEKAVDFLRKNIVFDDVELFLDTAKESFLGVLEKLKKIIEKESESKCRYELQRFDTPRIQRKMKLGTYASPTGYDEYIEDIKWVIEQYRKNTRLGPKAEDVLKEFLEQKKEEEEKVYRMVKEVQGAKGMESTEITRSSLQPSANTSTSSGVQSDVSEEKLLQLVMKEQELKKQEMSENFFTFMKLKTEEYKRQLAEGAESATKTQEENDRFKETFLIESEPDGPRPKAIGHEMPPSIPGLKLSKKCKIL